MTNGTQRNGSSGDVQPDAAPLGDRELDLLWDSLSPRVTKELSQPLDPSLVSRRTGRKNRTYSYLEGHTAISQANRIFGHGGWGYEVVGGVNLRDVQMVNAETGDMRTSHAYTTTVRVDVPGAPSRTDVGFHAVNGETIDDHETAYKGAVTDALKRALRSFGDQFGNGLYGDVPKRIPVKDALTSPKGTGPGDNFDRSHLASLRVGLINLGAEQGFDVERVKAAVRTKTGKELDELTIEELDPLVESARKRIQQMEQDKEREGRKAA